ncbi:tRNA lysidine(34) synthetase TilS [Telmatobacter bradus]|uniref:tRNA lysidine(34) synthetase TilS n=1 Tax=Telmatobacter bradus TaxID=474953 RepID=UPI003B4283F7
MSKAKRTGSIAQPVAAATELHLDLSLLRPGMRLGVGVSGGADSVALLRALHARKTELGLVLHVAHLHHGLRGAEADGDLEFVRSLSAELGLEFHSAQVDVAAEVQRTGETTEEAARRLRYDWFGTLMSKDVPHAVALDAVATAHTRDDQAETVLAKLLRGAWTEGLSGIHPRVEGREGATPGAAIPGFLILRPLLHGTRVEVEAYLKSIGQSWREDGSNRSLEYTRNRIRHELLPQLEKWNPKLKEKLAQMAELAREEELWWAAEVERVAGQLLLRGRAVRGGGRAAGETLAMDVTRLAALPVALERRLLRYAVAQLGVQADFAGTEALRRLGREGRAGQKLELAGGLRAERTPRELQFFLAAADAGSAEAKLEVSGRLPCQLEDPATGLKLRIELEGGVEGELAGKTATLRGWKAGDRVRMRYSSGERKVKEVLERMKISGSQRVGWPVLELAGRIVWMRGVELEPEPGLRVAAEKEQP